MNEAHAGMVGLDGEKMSKSRGNLVFVSELRRSEVDPMAIRLTLLRHHYRSDWGWDDAELWAAVDTLAEWRRAFALHAGAPSAPVVAEVLTAMADDPDEAVQPAESSIFGRAGHTAAHALGTVGEAIDGSPIGAAARKVTGRQPE